MTDMQDAFSSMTILVESQNLPDHLAEGSSADTVPVRLRRGRNQNGTSVPLPRGPHRRAQSALSTSSAKIASVASVTVSSSEAKVKFNLLLPRMGSFRTRFPSELTFFARVQVASCSKIPLLWGVAPLFSLFFLLLASWFVAPFAN